MQKLITTILAFLVAIMVPLFIADTRAIPFFCVENLPSNCESTYVQILQISLILIPMCIFSIIFQRRTLYTVWGILSICSIGISALIVYNVPEYTGDGFLNIQMTVVLIAHIALYSLISLILAFVSKKNV